MDRYRKLEKPKVEIPVADNEIRITSQGRIGSYITYAMSLFQEKGLDEIVFNAVGIAINNAVTIVEVIKRRIVSLHQITTISSIDVIDTWEQVEEGLRPVQTSRHVSVITITLSKRMLDPSFVGYQPPIPGDQVKPIDMNYEKDRDGYPFVQHGGGRSRERRGDSSHVVVEIEDGGWEQVRNNGRQGRGHNFHGHGRRLEREVPIQNGDHGCRGYNSGLGRETSIQNGVHGRRGSNNGLGREAPIQNGGYGRRGYNSGLGREVPIQNAGHGHRGYNRTVNGFTGRS